MHGLVFVTWEKYLLERFKGVMLSEYRERLGLTTANSPLAVRTYPDKLFLQGIGIAHEITKVPVDTLLREYGRYFIANGLTRHRCAYLLNQSYNGRDLLLAMRDAHEQMKQLPDGLTPPLFGYRLHPSDPNTLMVIYDSKRKLCPLLHGAIEGAAAYYGESITVSEQTCMRRGDKVCTFVATFSGTHQVEQEPPEVQLRHKDLQDFADQVFALLPATYGLTLVEIQEQLRERGATTKQSRPALILQALTHLHHAGLVASSANEPGDDFDHRRYWRVQILHGHH